MNIVRGVADLLRKAPAPPPAPPAVPSSSFGVREGSFHGADQDVAPSPRVVFSDSTEERVLNTLWKKYENALNKAEKEKSLQIFVLQFVQTFRDWGPYHNIHLVDQEQGSDETVVGCSHGHPSEVILILIQEMSIITSTIAESGNSPESSPNYSEQPGDLGLSTERLHVLECLTILTRSMHNCRVFSYYGGVKKVTSLLKAAVAQLKIQNSLLAADNHVSCQAVENIKMMLNMLKYIVTIISNFMKLEPTILRIPHFLNSTKCASSKNHLATVTPSTSESGIFDTLQRWQQRAIVLVMGAGGVNSLVELLRVIQRLNSEQWTDLSLHFITLCTLRSTISGTRAQNHVRSIGGLEILLDGLGLPSSKFSVLKNSSIPKDERFGNVNNLQFLCENGRVHKFANCICWPAFMILEFHRQRDNTGPSLALDSISGPIYFLDITEWREYSVKLSNALCSFIIPSKVISYCRNEIACNKISLSIPSAYREQSVRWFIRVLMTVFLCIKACTSETELPNHIKILAKTLQLYMIRTFRMVLVSKPTLLTAFREEGVWDLIFSENCFYFGSSVEDMQFHIVAEVQNEDINGNTEPTDSESLYLSDVNILQLEAISFLEYAATLNENKYNLPECSALLEALEHCIYDPVVVSILLKSFRVILQLATEQTLVSFKSLDVITGVLKAACQQAKELQNFSCFPSDDVISSGYGSKIENIEMSSSGKRTEYAIICIELALSLFKEYVTISSYGRILILHNPDCIECLFNLFQEKNFRKHVLEQIFALFRLPPSSKQDHAAKLQLCSKYLENFTRANEKEKVNSELLVDLLVNMREIIMMDRMYYQNLFRDGGCFLYIVSLLNGTFNEATGEQLVLNVLETLTLLLEGNDASKNEDVVILVLNILQKSSTSLQHYGLVVLQQLLKQSIANRTSCFRAGLLSYLLDWFSVEERDDTVGQIADLIQIIGAHSISGKDIRKIFALLRCGKIVAKKKHSSLLLTCLSHMLKEKGPEAFFEFDGHDSGIEIKSPFQWPYNRGLSFSCWLRVENFPENGMMGLFSFFTEDGKGYPKMNEAMTHCTIGTKLMPVGEQPISIGYERTFAFTGQMGPIYVFSDALSSEQIKGIYNLGPSYMYSFHGDDSLYRGILDARDGISSKIIFGFNAQASDSRSLFSVSSALDSADRSTFEATIMGGTNCNAVTDGEQSCHTSVINGKLRAEVIELVASVLDANVSNQQQMYLLSGLSIMGFLLQSATPKLLNIETLSALKYMFDVLRNCGMSKVLLKDAILQIYLNPQIWVHSSYEVQRDLYMFLLKYFETDGRFLPLLCGLPRIIDIVCQYYSEYVDCRCAVGSKSLLRTGNKQVVGDRPKIEEICKLRLLLLSLAEMSLKESEPVRLLGLQLVGKLMAGIPSERKGAKLFTLPIGQSRPLSDNSKNEITAASHLFFYTISERLFKFPLSYNLCAAFFNVLLGGTSPIKEYSQSEQSKNKSCSTSHLVPFFLPQILVCIFRYLQSCQDSSARIRILSELIGLLDSNPTNIEALMEHSWNYWLETSTKLDVLKEYSLVSKGELDNVEIDEVILVRKLYALVLAYYLSAVKGGWHQLEDTVNYFLLKFGQTSSEENIILSQPCCDNVLYLLKLIQELLFNQIGIKLLFPSNPSEESLSSIKWKDDIKSTLNEILIDESHSQYKSFPWKSCQFADEDEKSEDWWNFFDKVWDLICNLNGKGPNKLLPKGPNIEVPSLGQRARGLVESLNVPATEMAAAVVSGGIGTALGAKINRFSEKATLLREEIFPRVFFHLVILYLCKAGLENASKCVLQFMSLLPVLISEDEQSKNKLHFLIWSLLITRSQYGQLDDGARYHVLSHLILETIICGKSMLVPNILGRDDSMEIGNSNKDTGFILNFVQKDRVLAAATVEVKHMKAVQADRLSQLDELQSKLNEHFTEETQLEKMIEDNIHISITSALSADDKRKIAFRLAFDEDQQIVADKWIHISRALIDERGPWSANPFPNDVVTHWKLDKTEDKWRRRLKLKRNYKFDERLCQPSYSRNESTEACVDQSSLSTKVPLKLKRFLLKGVRAIFEDNAYEPIEDTNDTGESSQSSLLENQNPNNVSDLSDYRTAVQNKKESASNNGDNDYTKVLCSVHCVLITPKRKLAGQLDITRTVLHFSFEFLVEGTGGSSVFSKFKEIEDSDCKSDLGSVERLDGGRDYVIKTPNGVLMQKQSNKIKHHRRWNITKIKAVHWTRYLLQYTATEIFFDDSNAPIFLNFSSQKDAKNAGSLLVSLRNEALFPKGSTKGKSKVISFVDRRVALEMAENARDRWIKREISNFEYLMILNTLAGRSYNDLTQYPVFPWVLTDYTSEKLDFNKSSTFRDLSKPIGALDEKRFEVFEDRYVNFDDPDIPSFYYGSHYSTMGIVLHYLLRLEPFTTLHRSLQGGKFDHADRLFQSIDSAYKNSLSNTSDVKELIPEFFYMPEFLENSNSYHLGVRQDGEPLGDVVLPPWAKGSPEEFIHINREALESEYVSSNLHHWIDLIFGYKQRGQPAVEAANIFYYVTYEGAVDLENMDDLLQKSAIEDQIANFGQTPIQIFRVKHPRRGPPVPIAHPLYFAPQSIALTSSVSSTISHMSALLFIGLLDNTVILMNEGLILSIKLWLTTQLQSGGNFTFSGPQDHFFGIGSDVISPRKIGTFLAENVNFGRQCLATMQINSDKYLILCGNWENSFQIISLSDGRIVQSIRQHKDVVACVAVSSRGNVVATGSYDTTVMIWHAFRGRPSDHVVMERPVHIFCGHDDIITCLFVSTELDIVISGSKDGTCIFHTLREGRYVRSIRHPSGIGLSKLVASQHGRVVFYSESDLSLHMYSINGKHIASSASGGRINCMELSCCGQFLVCAGEHGQIVLHSMHCLDIIRRYDGAGKTITSLSVTPEECFLAGTKDGSLLVFSMESPLLRRKSMPRTRIKPPTASY
uniref:BEACH domain-containing protein n=1 Tax=Oryza rufipogon TaxID=4529 RepID=A0A0E0Q1M9_ORYRU